MQDILVFLVISLLLFLFFLQIILTLLKTYMFVHLSQVISPTDVDNAGMECLLVHIKCSI